MVEQKQAAVVGKNVSAPRPAAGSSSAAVAPVQPQRMSAPEEKQGDAPGKAQDETGRGRGTRAGLAGPEARWDCSSITQLSISCCEPSAQ